MRKFYLWMALFFAAVIGSWYWVKYAVPKTPVRIYPALATSIPADTKILVGLQVEQIKKSRLYQRFVRERKLPALERFVNATGIDPRRDVYEIVFASNGAEPIVFASGKFAELSSSTGQSTAELRPHAQIQGERMVRMPYKGATLIGNPNLAASFLNNATVMAARTETLKQIIDLREKNPLPPPDLLAALKELPAADPFWIVSTASLSQTMPNLQSGRMKLTSIPIQVDRILGSGTLEDGLRLNLRLESRDSKSIDQINATLRGLVALGRLNTPDDQAALLRLLDSIQIARAPQGLQLSMHVPEDLLEPLLNSFEMPR